MRYSLRLKPDFFIFGVNISLFSTLSKTETTEKMIFLLKTVNRTRFLLNFDPNHNIIEDNLDESNILSQESLLSSFASVHPRIPNKCKMCDFHLITNQLFLIYT